jgi:transcriptional regulator with XRE-family HTH domain
MSGDWTVQYVRQTIRKIRLERDLRAEDVAEAIGISRPFYTQIESGARGCTMKYFLRAMVAFDINPGDFFNGHKETHWLGGNSVKSLGAQDG